MAYIFKEVVYFHFNGSKFFFPSTACKEKLFCEKNCVDTSRPSVKRTRIIFTSKRTEALCATEIKANNRQTMKKGKYERNLSFVKGNGKGPHGSPSVHAGSGCNSSLSCSQNAIAFSQQQMIDTERLATKLLTELHLMKEIVVDTLYSESRTCTTSSNNTDKVNGLIYVHFLLYRSMPSYNRFYWFSHV